MMKTILERGDFFVDDQFTCATRSNWLVTHPIVPDAQVTDGSRHYTKLSFKSI